MANVKGFTLVELLVVLIIAVTATTLMAPNFSAVVDRISLRGETQKVISLLRFARSYSIAGGSIVEISTMEGHSLQMTGIPKTYRGNPKVSVSLEGDKFRVDRDEKIYFFPDGSSSGGVVRLQSTAGLSLVEVDWLTGKVAADEG